MIRRSTDTLFVPMGRRVDWRRATTLPLRPVPGDEGAPRTTVSLRADKDALELRFMSQATRLHAHMVNDGDPLYLEDVIEVFLLPGGDDPALYLEYEVSPLGRDLCLLNCQRDGVVNGWRPWGRPTSALPSCTVQVSGGPQRPDAAIRSWQADVRIPFAVFAGICAPPRSGDTWRANFFRIDHALGRAHHLAWRPPPVADFHRLDVFGTLTFKDAS